jgi:hypothetical protein
MDRKGFSIRTLVWLLVLFMVTPPWIFAQDQPAETQFQQEELDALLAPIALYPDELLSQILMAATYPLEIVQANRWVKANKNLKGDALAAALEKQNWDPSVKSLVNFPEVLGMMSEKLDWTEKLGDAFLASEKDVMDTVQRLRFKAEEAGNLKSTDQQEVIVQEKVIIIQPAQPQVVYIPSYNPAVVYGAWWWPAFPPPPPFIPLPPRPVLYGGLAFGAGVAMGAAWGYAWGRCNWHGGNVNININQNVNFNSNINRNVYAKQYQGGGGTWQHNVSHRKGVAYRDQATAQKFNRGSSGEAVKSREAYRGRADQGGQALQQGRGTTGGARQPASQQRPGAASPQAPQQRPVGDSQQASPQRPAGAGQQASQQRPGAASPQAPQQRPVGDSQQASQQRPAGVGQQASQQRPGATSPQAPQQRPAGAGQQASQQRPAGAGQQASRQRAGGSGGQAGQQRSDNAFVGIGNGKQTQNYSTRGSMSRSGGSTGREAGGGGSSSSGSRGGGSSGSGARGGEGRR